MNWKVPLSDLDYGPQEEEAVLSVLRSRWLTMGELTLQFERTFAELIKVRHAIAVSSGTASLHLACLALGIGPGDEVIVPSLTFVATANSVLHTGARVRFADIIGPEELNISPQSLESCITPQTKAILVVHYAGYPCRMEQILEIAARHGLHVIEDSAHAPGASLAGRSLGTWGDAGCFSFFSNKNLSTGEGGMVVTNKDDIAEKVRLLRSHGMTSLTWARHKGHAFTYDVTDLGYNYRIDELRSALGLVQLKKLSNNNIRRKQFTERYWDTLSDIGIELPFRDAVGESSHHIMPVLLPDYTDRQRFMSSMRESGIQTSIHYPPVHQFQYYRQHYPGVELPHTEDVARRAVTLPLYPTMGETAVDSICVAFSDAMDNASMSPA